MVGVIGFSNFRGLYIVSPSRHFFIDTTPLWPCNNHNNQKLQYMYIMMLTGFPFCIISSFILKIEFFMFLFTRKVNYLPHFVDQKYNYIYI